MTHTQRHTQWHAHFLQRKHLFSFPLISHFTHSTEHYRSFWFSHSVFKGIDRACFLYISLQLFLICYPFPPHFPSLQFLSQPLGHLHVPAPFPQRGRILDLLPPSARRQREIKKSKNKKYVPWLPFVPRAWHSWLSVTELRTSSVPSQRSPNHTPPGWLSEPYSVNTPPPPQPQ